MRLTFALLLDKSCTLGYNALKFLHFKFLNLLQLVGEDCNPKNSQNFDREKILLTSRTSKVFVILVNMRSCLEGIFFFPSLFPSLQFFKHTRIIHQVHTCEILSTSRFHLGDIIFFISTFVLYCVIQSVLLTTYTSR